MKALVLYDSKFGNTAVVARAIAERAEARASVDIVAAKDIPASPAAYDVVFVGGPTHKHGMSSAMREALKRLTPGWMVGRSLAAFDTRYKGRRILTGSAAASIARAFRRAGAEILAGPESFYVDAAEGPLVAGETERAAQWADSVLKAVPPGNVVNSQIGETEVQT